MNYILEILSKSQKKNSIKLLLLMIITAGLEVFSLSLIFLLINFFSNPNTIPDSLIFDYLEKINLEIDYGYLLIIIFFISFLLKTLLIIFYNWYHGMFFASLRANLASLFFKGYTNMPKLFHTRTNISETVKNVTVETNYLVEAIQALLLIVLEVFMLISITAFLLIINFKITCYVFLIMIVFSILIYLFNSKILQKLGIERMRFTEQRLKAIFEGLSSSKLLENKSIKEKSINNFDTHNFNLANIARIQYFRNTIPKPLFELLVMVFIVLSFSLFLLSKQNLTTILPLLGTFLAAGYRLTPSFGRIITALQTYKFTILAGSKLLSDKRRFDLNKAHVDKKQIGNLQNKSLDISNLTFSYEKNLKDEKKIVFKNLNIKINIGKKIGIVGESGSGKSTLLDLIMGLLPFEKGKILINGNSVDDIKSQWQSKISCVPQNIFISDQSLKNNIAFGEKEKEIDLKKIDKALKISNLNEFKDDSKFGLDTLLGENGARISGGQRQRIGIARAIYNNSEILILDESTNALDSKNEKKIIEEIFNNALNKTIIIVSHNKENFKFCDEVYEIKNKELNKLTSI